MELRDYQSSACTAILESLQGGARPILVLPTGAGKSVCAVAIAAEFQRARPGSRVLFLAHRRELVIQMASHLERSGLRVGIIKAGFPRVPDLPVQVASVQTLGRRDLPPADLLVWDESHHVLAKTFLRISDAYGQACQMGLTATPWRLDGHGLGGVFTKIVVGAYADDLCRQPNPATGLPYLIEPRVYAPPAANIAGVHRRAGDYVIRELAAAVDRPRLVADVVQTWLKHARGVSTVAFGVNVAHSQHIVEQFRTAGVAAEHCDGETPEGERDAILHRLASGETQIVSNVNLFGEGFDLPRIKCVILARPTESMALYYQMTGRAMRPTDGSPAIVLDHAGLVHRFGRVTQRLEYSLEGAPDTETKAADGHGLKTCPKCFRMVLRWRTVCPECGYSLAAEAEIPEFEPGELVRVDGDGVTAANGGPAAGATSPALPPPSRPADEREDVWRYIEETRIEQKRAPGWAVAEFKRRFGVIPQLVHVAGLRVLATRNASESVRDAAWEQFKAEARERGKEGRDVYAYAAAKCVELFGSVPAAAAARAKTKRKARNLKEPVTP